MKLHLVPLPLLPQLCSVAGHAALARAHGPPGQDLRPRGRADHGAEAAAATAAAESSSPGGQSPPGGAGEEAAGGRPPADFLGGGRDPAHQEGGDRGGDRGGATV